MKTWTVECTGNVRELYSVEAETAEEAMANWASGDCFLQESSTTSRRPSDSV